MVDSVTNSFTAYRAGVAVNIQIMRAFVKLREMLITHKDLARLTYQIPELARAERGMCWGIGELLEHVRGQATKPFVYPMVVFAAHTGSRRSEMLRSKIRDVDFDSAKITIREKKRDHSRSTTRRVPMSPVLRRVLNAWLHEPPGGPSLFCDGTAGDGLSVPAEITHDVVHDHFKRTLAASKWSKMRGWHCLRHSFASTR